MDDEQILAKGGTQRDIEEYAEQNGANPTETLLQKLQREAREGIYDFPGKYWIDTENVSIAHAKLCSYSDSLVEKAYTSALQEAIGCLPGMLSELKGSMEPEEYENNSGFNSAVREMTTCLNKLLMDTGV